jgi:hypothetical protein
MRAIHYNEAVIVFIAQMSANAASTIAITVKSVLIISAQVSLERSFIIKTNTTKKAIITAQAIYNSI